MDLLCRFVAGVDNTICTYGGLVQFRKGTLPLLIELATKFTTILINTKLPRDTKRLVSMVAERREKYKSIIDGILNSMDQVSTRALQCMQKINTKTLNDFELLNSYETLGVSFCRYYYYFFNKYLLLGINGSESKSVKMSRSVSPKVR